MTTTLTPSSSTAKLEMTSSKKRRFRRQKKTTKTVPSKPISKLFSRAGDSFGIWWRRIWYRFGRGSAMRLLVKTFGWHYPAVKGTFASSKQTPALMTVLTNTDLDYHGDPLGVNLWTNQAILESAWTLYSDGWINSPNQCILGALGTAKSTYVKTILLRSMMHGGRAVVFDRKRQAQKAHASTSSTRLSCR